jgi:PAS domain S-box-containing protein
MALLDRDATTLFVNHAVPGLTKAQMIGSSFYDFTPKEYEQPTRECFERVLQTGQPEELESSYRYGDGTFQYFESYVGPVERDGEIVGLTVSSRDITERKRAEEKINALLEEKELLLREVHHRIKNNMNTMVSLLSLQSETLEDWKAVAALEDAKSRLHSMSVLYDKLYRAENLREMSIKHYLPALVDEIIDVFPNKASVQIETRIDDFVLDVKLLPPLGIIVNELLTNAMKYAFIGRDDGLIKVSAAIKDHRATLVIEDNGNGIPEAIDIETSSGFGLQLVDRLTKQIGGTIKIERENGTRFVLEFGV